MLALVQGEGDVDPTGRGAGGIDVQLLSVCLAALMALFRLPELCREVPGVRKWRTEGEGPFLKTCVRVLLGVRNKLETGSRQAETTGPS